MVTWRGTRMRDRALMNSLTCVVDTTTAARSPQGNTLRKSRKNDDSMVLSTPASSWDTASMHAIAAAYSASMPSARRALPAATPKATTSSIMSASNHSPGEKNTASAHRSSKASPARGSARKGRREPPARNAAEAESRGGFRERRRPSSRNASRATRPSEPRRASSAARPASAARPLMR